jgi:hypothetical protein
MTNHASLLSWIQNGIHQAIGPYQLVKDLGMAILK